MASSPSNGELPSTDIMSPATTSPVILDTQQPCRLLRLPTELLLDICDLVNLSDHNKLVQTCRYLAPQLNKYLYQRAADRGYPSIKYGILRGRVDTIRRSLDFGFPPSIDDAILAPLDGGIHFADHHDSLSVHGPATNVSSLAKKCTLLCFAIKAGSVAATNLLLSRGAKSIEGSDSTCSPLIYAIQEIKPGVVQTILAHGADPNQLPIEDDQDDESKRRTPLTEVLWRMHHSRQFVMEIILNSLLLDYGADPNLPDGNGETPLGIALRRGIYSGTIEALCERGADPNLPVARGGVTAFEKELKDGSFQKPDRRWRLVSAMIWAGADVNARYAGNHTPLTLALIFGFLNKHLPYPNGQAAESLSNFSRGYDRFVSLYDNKAKGLRTSQIDREERIDLKEVLDDDTSEALDPGIGLLLKAGAKVSRADLDRVLTIVEAGISNRYA